MLVSSLLLPLVAVTSVFASGSSDGESQQNLRPVSKVMPPQCDALEPLSTECPTCEWQDWCTPPRCAHAPEQHLRKIDSSFDLFSVVFGFDMPPNLKLCPWGKCDPKRCLCREVILKRISAFLTYEGDGTGNERDEL
ncbi:hypothetical protein B0T16DRAFT_455429 [Cercophora newfieldiana]|uniref:Secreted protein n=1 Tax=Cercophora newfieldiana TaxID=92897 RepID=A0AA39YI90_9PEZI|nr:hypothetical protein B0T16DRAFT_455429 [Cercophora newfieldiana]